MALSKAEWVLIEEEYRAGVKPVLQIAKAHHVDDSSVRQMAKKLGWLRNSPKASPDRINELIEASAQEYAGAIQTGLQISINCLNNLKVASETATEPKEIKLITDATSSAVKTIREIAGLDKPESNGAVINNNIQINAEQIGAIISDLQNKY